MSREYQPIPTSDADASIDQPNHTQPDSVDPTDPNPDRPLRDSVQREFNRPPPAIWKRVLLLVAIVMMGWYSLRVAKPKQKVIYAQRYSDEFKYRPAASPIITETLKDGRIRIRGASLGSTGVREEDVPKTPAQVAHEKKVRVDEARKRAREKVREGRRKGKGL